MTESNVLPYDGQAILINDNGAEFDWPAITRTLIDTIPWQVETARIFGRDMPIPRMTAWFGDGAYSYSGILHLPAPFPAIIDRLRERAEALSGGSFNAALANLYRNGRDSVGWHSDNEAGLGNCPTIVSLSLGGERRFQLGHRKTKQTITLGQRMGHWLIMAGETQRFWLHQADAAERHISIFSWTPDLPRLLTRKSPTAAIASITLVLSNTCKFGATGPLCAGNARAPEMSYSAKIIHNGGCFDRPAELVWQRVPETAFRLRGRIEAVLDAAKVRGLRSGENPAR